MVQHWLIIHSRRANVYYILPVAVMSWLVTLGVTVLSSLMGLCRTTHTSSMLPSTSVYIVLSNPNLATV